MCFLHSTFLFGFRKPIVEVVSLKGMSSSRMWVRIIENEEDVKKIEESFKCMDEDMKNFQVCGHLRIYWHANAIFLSSKLC